MLSLIANLFGAVKEFFGFQSKRLELKNSSAMQAAEAARAEAAARDRTAKAIQEGDLEAIRREVAE